MAEADPRTAQVSRPDTSTALDIDALLGVAASAARAAADVLLRHQRARLEGADLGIVTKTSATDPVSVADKESEQALVDLLLAQRPDDGLLGEEGADKPSGTGLRWVLDPLDGTVNYLYGHVGWSVSVAVEQQAADGTWDGVVGVVLEPSTGRCYAAARGRGATLDGRRLSANDPVPLEMALVSTGFSYDRDHRRRQAALAAEVLGHVRDIRRVGSAALDLCRVASGETDAYYEDSTQRWDWAAGALIAREAGAVVTPLVTFDGHSGVVAAGPGLHEVLTPLVSTLPSPA